MERVIYTYSAMPVTPQQRTMEQARRYEGELDARKRACPVRWRGKTLSSLDDMLIPLSFKWNHACTYCGKHNVPLQIEHIHPRAKQGSNRIANLCLACEQCNTAKGTQDIQDFLAKSPEVLTGILAQAKAPLRDAAAINATRWQLYRRLQALGLPVECGTGGRTKYNRTMRGLAKRHWIDASCVGKSTPEALQTKGIRPLFITASGHGCRQMCRMDRYGFPRTGAKQAKRVRGFQTGDMVKAIVPSGKKAGIYTGRVAIRSTGSFNIATMHGNVQGVSHHFCKTLHKCDGYHYQKGEAAFPPLA